MYKHLDLTHNTSDPCVKITYPFHPFYGQSLPVIFESDKPEPCSVCLICGIHRLRIPKWMTEAASESFSISEIPVIDPFCILKAKQLISQAFQSVINSGKLGLNPNQREAGHGKQTASASDPDSECVGKDGKFTAESGSSDYGGNDQADHPKQKQRGE